jgi:multidrug resistance efflux pump
LKQAESAVKLAQANYNLVAAGPTTEERQVAIAAAELELISAQQALDELLENNELIQAQARKQIAELEKSIENAERRVDYLQSTADESDIEIARAEVALAKNNLERAIEAYEPWANKPEDNLRRAQLLSRKAAAQQQYDAAVRKLNALEGTGAETDINLAEAELSLLKAQLQDSRNQLEIREEGPDPDQVALASARISLAEASLNAARANPSPEKLAVAQSQIDSAQTGLDVLLAQLDTLVLTSPITGVILSRNVEQGEVVIAGSTLMTLADLQNLTITVFIPEDRYGEIYLNQRAMVTVDSFPGQEFEARVVYIADEAEFTPRNVQTAEGRRSTVFAVRLSIEDPSGFLKPGMPADVVFVE